MVFRGCDVGEMNCFVGGYRFVYEFGGVWQKLTWSMCGAVSAGMVSVMVIVLWTLGLGSFGLALGVGFGRSVLVVVLNTYR